MRRNAIRAKWILVGALQLAGCDQSDCELRTCATTDSVAREEEDVVLELQSGGLVTLTTSTSEESEQRPESGAMVLNPVEPGCTPVPSAPCRLLLKEFELRFGRMDWELTTGERLSVDDAMVRIAQPLELESTGSGYVLSAGTSFQTCASVDRRRQSAQSASHASGLVTFNDNVGIFGIDAAFPMVVRRDDGACSELAVTCQAHLTFIPAPR